MYLIRGAFYCTYLLVLDKQLNRSQMAHNEKNTFLLDDFKKLEI